jgi:hypothetical protein
MQRGSQGSTSTPHTITAICTGSDGYTGGESPITDDIRQKVIEFQRTHGDVQTRIRRALLEKLSLFDPESTWKMMVTQMMHWKVHDKEKFCAANVLQMLTSHFRISDSYQGGGPEAAKDIRVTYKMINPSTGAPDIYVETLVWFSTETGKIPQSLMEGLVLDGGMTPWTLYARYGHEYQNQHNPIGFMHMALPEQGGNVLG